MIFASLLSIATVSGIFSQVSLAAPIIAGRDVYAPPVTYPHTGTVWYTGQRHNVTWDNSHPPENITNPLGKIFLRKSNRYNLNVLADGFDITLGRTEVQVPSVETGNDYQIMLMGDSGNLSPMFTIIAQ